MICVYIYIYIYMYIYIYIYIAHITCILLYYIILYYLSAPRGASPAGTFNPF